MDSVDIEFLRGEPLKNEGVEVFGRNGRANHFVEGRQVHRNLRCAQTTIGQDWLEQVLASTIAVVAKAETLLGFDHTLVRPPTGGRRAFDFLTEDVTEAIDATANLLDQLRLAPAS